MLFTILNHIITIIINHEINSILTMISPDCSELICPTEDVSVNPEFNSAWQAMGTRPALDLLHFCGYQLPEVRRPRYGGVERMVILPQKGGE